MQAPKLPRELTHDERKAADAAFKGLPFDRRWSPSAQAVYDGIRGALGAVVPSAEAALTDQTEPAEAPALLASDTESEPPAPILTRELQRGRSGQLVSLGG